MRKLKSMTPQEAVMELLYMATKNPKQTPALLNKARRISTTLGVDFEWLLYDGDGLGYSRRYAETNGLLEPVAVA